MNWYVVFAPITQMSKICSPPAFRENRLRVTLITDVVRGEGLSVVSNV